MSSTVIAAVDPVSRRIDVSLTREQVKAGPSMEAVDIPLAETLPTIWIM